MKRIFLLTVFLVMFDAASAQSQPAPPELYTPRQIEEKFGVAVKDDNWAPVVKNIIEWMNGIANKEEYNAENVVQGLKEIALRLPPPARNLVHFLVGDFYSNYWQTNRWQLRDRTSAPDAGGTIDTWDLDRLFREAKTYYLLSVEDAQALKSATVEDYDQILYRYTYRLSSSMPDFSDRIFTTLYDVLMVRIIEELSNKISVSTPSSAFVIDDLRFWGAADEFAAMKIETPEMPSAEHEGLTLYQKLLEFKLQEFEREKTPANVFSLIAMDIERLKYVRAKGVYDNPDDLYAAALRRIAETYASFAESGYADYELALLLKEQGGRWASGRDERWRNKYAEAYELLERTALVWKEFAPYARGVQKEISSPSISITLDKQQYPGDPFLATASYRNVDTMYILVYELYDESDMKYRYEEKPRWSWLSNREPVRGVQTVEMPRSGDFQPRTAQFMIDGIPQGFYALFASPRPFSEGWQTDKDFESNVSSLSFQVSPLMLNTRESGGKTFGLDEKISYNQLYVTDAKSGKPVGGAKIETFVEDYDSDRDRFGKFPDKLAGSHKTDREGMAYISKPDKNHTFSRIVVTDPKGGKLINTNNVSYSNIAENKTYVRAIFFTDRTIYRPGQTVFYKALLIWRGENKNEIAPGLKLEISLKDTQSNKIIAQQELTTNEYGSIAGSFVIPQGLLNGNFSINCAYGNIPIRVEEYKRPTFEVKLYPVKETCRFGDQVELRGQAVALAGYSVDNSTVKYQIRRDIKPIEIVTGEVVTDAEGRFTIPFTASSEGMKTTKGIAAGFVITVDVTDANGETRSASKTITVTEKPLILMTYISPTINDRDSLKFKIAVWNVNETWVAADVDVTIDELKGHDRILRPRHWRETKPDTTLVDRQVFEKLFPNNIYADEDNPATYPVIQRVSESQFRTIAESPTRMLDLGALRDQPAGWYRITLKAVNDEGITTEEIVNVRLNGTPRNNKPTAITDLKEWISEVKTSGEPGEEAVFLVAGPRKNMLVRYDVFHKGRIERSGTITVNPTPQRITFPIEERHRGGFNVQFIMVADGRTYTHSRWVDVPFTNKMLDISFTTFRNQLLPGERERWTLTVKNRAGEKEMAEMVATLYDASLDQFAPLRWPSESEFFPRQGYNPYAWNVNTWNLLAKTNNPGIFRAYIFRMPVVIINRFGSEYLALMRNDGRGNISTGNVLSSLQVLDPSFVITGIATRGRDQEILSNDSLKKVVAGARNFQVTEDGEIVIGKRVVAYDVMESSTGSATSQDVLKFSTMVIAESMENIATRQNFNETAFFYPQLRTNEQGEILIEFTIPESLTKWNMRGFAHTKDLKVGSVKNSLITQKQVAVSANAPRFFREGDTIELTAKAFNVTEENLSGEALLRLYDAATMQPLDGVLKSDATVTFSAAAGQSSGLRWTLEIPEGLSAITYRLTAQAGTHTDGEERTVPVLSNTIMLTETQPFMVRAGESRTVDFKRLRENAETVRRNHSLTLEFTSNPAWYAVLSMPYLMEFPYECSEQVFSRFYANSLSASVTDKTPGIKRIFEQWRGVPNTNALLSNLEKNQELKQVMLEETPWVLQAQDDTERKRRIGMLFDLNTLADQQRVAFGKLAEMQLGSGGFAWFSGLAPSRHITQHIIAGFGQLTHLNALNEDFADKVAEMTVKGFAYLDADLQMDYAAAKRSVKFDPKNQYISYVQLHYLYAASFSKHVPENREAFDFYYAQAKAHWRKFNLYGQGLAALAFHRYGDTELAREVVAALKAVSSRTEDMGMFWRGNRRGYFWHEAPIETQALMIGVFDEAGGDPAAVEEMKIWLLRNKQTNSWSTTKATADACYALLMTGSKLLDESDILDVRIGGKPLAEAASGEIRPEAGTGYVKTVWAGSDITPAMGTLVATNTNKSGIAWGGMFWQYFEKLDNVTSAETDLRMEKQIFIKRSTPRGVELTSIADGAAVNVGDLLTVRVILRAHRDYEYVHLKDMRASGLEPVRTLSGYRRQDGLLYYENIKDASTNFFITTLSAGTYVFEYDLRVSHAGDFSNGVTTFQCMYAPEFSAHSAGTRLKVE